MIAKIVRFSGFSSISRFVSWFFRIFRFFWFWSHWNSDSEHAGSWKTTSTSKNREISRKRANWWAPGWSERSKCPFPIRKILLIDCEGKTMDSSFWMSHFLKKIKLGAVERTCITHPRPLFEIPSFADSIDFSMSSIEPSTRIWVPADVFFWKKLKKMNFQAKQKNFNSQIPVLPIFCQLPV